MVNQDLVDRIIEQHRLLGLSLVELNAAVLQPGIEIRLTPPGDNLQSALDSLAISGGTIRLSEGYYPRHLNLNFRNRLISIVGEGTVNLRGFSAGLRSGNIAFENIGFINPMTQIHITLGADRHGMKTFDDIPQGFSFLNCRGDGGGLARRGISANCRDLIVDGCDFDNYCGVGQDSQAIAGWNGAINHRIINSRLCAASENIAYGGNDAALESMFPRDIYIGNCELTKKREWAGMNANMKCIVETKNVIGFTLTGCRLSGCWKDAWGNAPAIVLKSSNQDNTNPNARTENVLIEDNIVGNVGSYITLIGKNDGPNLSGTMRNIRVRNNIFHLYNGEPDGDAIRIGDGVEDAWFDHNSFLGNTHAWVVYWGLVSRGIKLTNNLAWHGRYGFNPTLPPVGWECTHNALLRSPTQPNDSLPPTNVYYGDISGDMSAHITSDGLLVGATI